MKVAELRAALEGLPDDMPVLIEQDCSEGCGIGSEDAVSARVDDQDWPPKGERLAFVITDQAKERRP